ncbi:LysR family transcriptional regulator [Planktotalea sp.]|uniref:LysR family transcriptional regulator n=1 Tax=Planktotalea sp. TaxID=2029877 RepID=UPI0032989876
MKIQQLKFFVAVYEEGSFSAGAIRVNATQSGLSMHVRQLENRYGVTLLNRSSTGAEPTEAGRTFYKRALETLNAAARAEDALKELSGSVSGQIDVGLMPTFTGSILSSTLLRFAQEYKHVRVSIHEAYSAVLSNQVAEGLLDFAVVPSVSQDLGLDTFRLAKDRECLVCSSKNSILKGNTGSLRDLEPLHIVLPTEANARRPRIDQYLSMNEIKVAETMELDAMLGTLDIVANSDWVSILPGILGRADRDGVKRRFIPLSEPPLAVEYMRISHKARPLNRAAQAFLDTLQQELNNALEDD